MSLHRHFSRRLRTLFLGCCLVTVLSGCHAPTEDESAIGAGRAAASDGHSSDNSSNPKASADTGPSEVSDLQGEHLLARAPAGWVKVYASLRKTQRMVEYVPKGSTGENWQQKISFESFNHKPLPDPIDLVTSIANDQKKACEGFEDYNTFSGYENNYPTSVRLLICKSNKFTQQGQVTLIKTIQGQDNFFVVTRAMRSAPITAESSALSTQDMARWSLYLRAVSVCDPSRRDHPCPSGETARDAPTDDFDVPPQANSS